MSRLVFLFAFQGVGRKDYLDQTPSGCGGSYIG
jgi:hypothetical protein